MISDMPQQSEIATTPTAVADTQFTQQPLFEVAPASRWPRLDVKTLWHYRELFFFLVWRDVKVRYKQTVLGIAWAVLQPLLTMVVFSLFFGYLGKMSSDGLPYPVFTYAALLPWQLFANSLSASSNSLVMNQQLLSKVYFPRLVVPISAVFVGLVDFLLAFAILVLMMIYYGIVPTMAIVTLPLFLFLALLAALGVGLWLSALNVQYRDIQLTIPFVTQFWLIATPIAYSSSIVPEAWRLLYGLNPMVGVVEGFRWALLGQSAPDFLSIAVSTGATVVIFISGLFYFRRMEQTFADIV